MRVSIMVLLFLGVMGVNRAEDASDSLMPVLTRVMNECYRQARFGGDINAANNGLCFLNEHKAEIKDHAFAQFLVGEFSRVKGDWTQAQHSYESALRLGLKLDIASQWAALDGLAMSLVMQKKYQEAIPSWEKALPLRAQIDKGEAAGDALVNPNGRTASTEYNLACCQAELGQFKEAYRHLQRCIALDPKKADQALNDASFQKALTREEFRILLRDWNDPPAPPPGTPLPSFDETSVLKAVRELGDAEFSVREAASARLAEWGAGDPDRLLPLLPKDMADAEVASRCQELRERIPWFAVHRRLLALAEGDPFLKEAVRKLCTHHAAASLETMGDLLEEKPLSKRQAFARPIALFLRDPDLEVRRMAAYWLGQWKEPSVVPDLIPLLTSPDHTLSQTAASALEGFRDRSVVPAALKLLESPDPAQRAMAPGLLALGDASVLPALGKLLEDPDAKVRWMTAGAIGHLGNPAGASLLVQALRDSDFTVRDTAGYQLANPNLRNRRVVLSIAKLLEGEPESTARAAATALSRLLKTDWKDDVAAARAWWKGHQGDLEFRDD